jgi:tetratricopeptide (TPR) repeat protein/predicted Ser/Thr protein kinase
MAQNDDSGAAGGPSKKIENSSDQFPGSVTCTVERRSEVIDASIADAPSQLRGPHQRLDEDERATAPGARDQEDTDEQRAGEATVDDGDPLQDSAPRRTSFEHRRIVDVARRQLFGRGAKGAERATRIGRYAIEGRLGSGGMGDVYLAHDAALDRKVAIKRVRVTSARERDQERLRREARALARLSHPNVVQVYEVDEHEGRTFLAMEYVAGQTLGEWLAEAARTWRAVLEVFLAAGRGLAAAHAAGLVHRDFKPDNVLLGRDGSVRVADFGLVLAGEDQRVSDGDASSSMPTETRMSVTGAVLGTIRYMSLEQLLGREVDARSDQFSFCVALYEAVWGKPPFSLVSSLARLTDLQTTEAVIPRARQGTRPSAALWRVIARGLRREPEERWPDMPTLLAALKGVMGRRRRLAWMGGAIAAAAGAMVMGEEPTAEPCVAVSRELQGAWDDERRAALATAVAGLSASHANDSEQRVTAGLDRWSEGWTEVRTEVCLAQAEQRIEPERARGRNACLARQRQRAGDLVELLLEPHGGSADALAGAVDAVAELPMASACEDEPMLGPPPPPAAIAEEVEALRRDVDRAHELRLLGRVEEGLALAERTEVAARSLGFGPLLAEALAERAKAELAGASLPVAMAHLQDAIDAAELHHDDILVADLWTESAMRTLTDLSDERAGAWQLRRAEVANERIVTSHRARGRLAFAHGRLAELRGEDRRAEQSYRAALTETEGDEVAALDRPSYFSSLARLMGRGAPSSREAFAFHISALEEAEERYGVDHPQTAQRAYLLGVALQAIEPDQAAVLLRRAAEIWSVAHVRPTSELATAHLLLSKLALSAGDIVSAEAHARTLAALQATSLPAGHEDHGDTASLFATIYAIRGDHEEALRQARLAVALWGPEVGIESPSVQQLLSNAAAMLLALGRVDEAAEQLEQLLPHVLGGPEEISVRLNRCEAELRRGRIDTANAELLAIENNRATIGDHEFSYAVLRALVDSRRGELRPEAAGHVRIARGRTLFTSNQITAWITQLNLSETEREWLPID